MINNPQQFHNVFHSGISQEQLISQDSWVHRSIRQIPDLVHLHWGLLAALRTVQLVGPF